MFDPLGNYINEHKKYQRIISLVPSQTELLYDLGLNNEVIGITKFCIYPTAWHKQKTIIGGTKNFRFELIDQLKPDLIIANKEENYQEGILKLQEKYPVYISDIYTLEDALQMIENVGEICHKKQNAQEMAHLISTNFQSIQPASTAKKVAYFIWDNPMMAVGNTNFIHNILQKCGFNNVFSHLERYPQISLEELQKAQPEYIFLSTEPYPFTEKHFSYFKEVLPKSTLILVNGEYFSWYGSRLQYAPEYFQQIITQIS